MQRWLRIIPVFSLAVLIISGCAGSSSPLIPDDSLLTGSHAATIETALDGVEVLNNDILSIKLAGTELLPYGIVEILLAPEGAYPLEVTLAEPETEILLSAKDCSLLVNGEAVDLYRGPANADISLADLTGRISFHLELVGNSGSVRDITLRTQAFDHLLMPDRAEVTQYNDLVSGQTVEIVERELLIGIGPGIQSAVVEALVNALDCEILRVIPRIDVYRLRIPRYGSSQEFIRLYRTSSIVEFAEVNSVLYPGLVPNDTYESQEYGNGLMQLYDAWDITTGTSATTIAVVDSGVMRDHPDLYQNCIEGEDFIWPVGDGLGGETPGDGIDNDSDFMVDEVVGHGTHCAGIIGAVGNNAEGISGHSWSTKILPLRVFPIDGDSGAWSSDVADAIIYAADQGVDGISLSLGSYNASGTIESAVNYAWNHGSVIVAAAGNSNTSALHYPSAFDNVIAVASTNWADKKSGFSNYGSWVDCSAPGDEIVSSVFYEHGGDPWSVPENQRYMFKSGTSMACPQVAGLVALAASYFPAFSNAELVEQILLTTDNIDSLNPGYIGKLGTGRINDYKTLAQGPEPAFDIIRLYTDDDNPLLSQGNRDGFLNPGEIIEFRPEVRNTGLATAGNCRISIFGDPGLGEMLFDSVLLGDVEPGDEAIPVFPLVFRINPGLTEDAVVELNLRFEYDGGDPLDVPFELSLRTDIGMVDTVTCTGEDLLEGSIEKGTTGISALSLTIESDVDYAILDELVVHQSGTAPNSSFTELQLWLDSDENGEFSEVFDTRVGYRSYGHLGYRGYFDDLNDPFAGFGQGADYEDLPPVYFEGSGIARFKEIVVPTLPGVPRTLFIVIGIQSLAATGDTVQLGILTKDDIVVRIPDQVSPVNFPILTAEVPIVGYWSDPEQLTFCPPTPDVHNSLKPECAVCPVTGNIYLTFYSNRSGYYICYIRRSVDGGETFEPAQQIDVDADYHEGFPHVKVDSAGVVHVVYYSLKNGDTNRELYYTRSYDYGLAFDTPKRLTFTNGNSRIPKLAIGPDEGLNVVWEDEVGSPGEYNVYYMRSDNGGDTWNDSIKLSDAGYNSIEASIAVGGDGIIHVSYDEFLVNDYSGNVYYTQSGNDGLSFSAPICLTYGDYADYCWHNDIGADNNENVYVVFHSVDWASSGEISMVFSNDSGGSWNPIFDLTNNEIWDTRPSIYVRPDDGFIDVIYRSMHPDIWDIFHLYSNDGMGSWTEPAQVSHTIYAQVWESIVVRGDDLNSMAYWEEKADSEGSKEIFYNLYIY